MTIELANKIRNGRTISNLYAVTRRDEGKSGVLAAFETRAEAEAFIAKHEGQFLSLANWLTLMDARKAVR